MEILLLWWGLLYVNEQGDHHCGNVISQVVCSNEEEDGVKPTCDILVRVLPALVPEMQNAPASTTTSASWMERFIGYY